MMKSNSLAKLTVAILVAGLVTSFTHVQAQEATSVAAAAGAAPAAVAAAAPAASAASGGVAAAAIQPEPTLWRFLGIPQGVKGLRTLRGRIVNRRGNFPGLERKPPMVPLTAPENLESPNPAIKVAAEIKQAEDMKKQKIKAIKYLASLGCGCYDKDGKITDALLAGTDDCTPDVRLAVLEAIEDNVNKCKCNSCGTTSCCNGKIRKRLGELAFERDDDGCPLETSAEIRRAAKRVFHKCCPGGRYTGPIEQAYEPLEEMPEDESVEMIPAPEPGQEPAGEKEEKIRGESTDEESDIKGESADDEAADNMDLGDDEDVLKNPFKDNDELEAPEDIEAPDADAEDLIMRRVELNQPVEMSLCDADSPVVERNTGMENSDFSNGNPLVPIRVTSLVLRKPVTKVFPAKVCLRKVEKPSRVERVVAAPITEALMLNSARPAASLRSVTEVRQRQQVPTLNASVLLPSRSKSKNAAQKPAAQPKLVDPPQLSMPAKEPARIQSPADPQASVRSASRSVRTTSYAKTASTPSRNVLQFPGTRDTRMPVGPSVRADELPLATAIEPRRRIRAIAKPNPTSLSQSDLVALLSDPAQRLSAYGDIASTNPGMKELFLKPLKSDGLRVGTQVDIIRLEPSGPKKIGTAVVQVVGRTMATATFHGDSIQSSDKFICRYQ